MTAKPKKPAPRDEDPEESKRFLDLAREMEAAGELSPTDAEGAFDRVFRKIVPARPATHDESHSSAPRKAR